MKFSEILKLICTSLTALSSTVWAVYTAIKNQKQINYWNDQDKKPKQPIDPDKVDDGKEKENN